MGLDMYLCVNSKRLARQAHEAMEEFDRDWYRKRDIAIYWRKANAIHKWFVDHCHGGDFDDYHGWPLYVEFEQLEELKSACDEVLASSRLVERELEFDKHGRPKEGGGNFATVEVLEDDGTARRLLPVQEGFFFGSYSYDRYYVQQLEYTSKAIEAMLRGVIQDPESEFKWHRVHEDEPDWLVSFQYSASW